MQMNIEFKRLTEVNRNEIIDLMNNHLVREQLPLSTRDFNEDICEKFIALKELLWVEHGYGPWAFIINNEFAGWGGLQPENGDADLALVLHPNYWGAGIYIYNEIIMRAFGKMGLKSVTVLFPLSRTRVQGLLRLGFNQEGESIIKNERFIKYRLEKHNTVYDK